MEKTMRLINQQDYAHDVEDTIENEVFHVIAGIFASLMNKYHFTPNCDPKGFEDCYYTGYDSDIRDIVIAFFEDCGMDIEGDGRDF